MKRKKKYSREKRDSNCSSRVKIWIWNIKKIFSIYFYCEVEPNFHLELDLGLDSLDIVEILSFIETNFGVKISEEQFSNLKSILDIAKFIKENGGEYHEEEMDWKNILNQDIDDLFQNLALY